MPALKAVISADSTKFMQELRKIESASAAMSMRLKSQMAVARNTSPLNTFLNPNRFPSSMEESYQAAWQRMLREKETAELESAITSATRSNRARALLRQRGTEREKAAAIAEQTAIDEAVNAASRNNRARALLRQRAENRAATQSLIADQLMNTATRGAGNVFGEHGMSSGGGGFSGIIRETLVLFREATRGNWTRMAGSITLLAQYMGVLGTVVKSTAAASIQHAAALNKESIAAAQSAIAAKVKAKATYDAAIANGEDAVSAEALAASDNLVAASAERAAEATEAKAVAAKQAAEMEAAAATVSLGPLGWIAAALIAVGTAAFFVIRHFNKLRREHQILKSVMDESRRTFGEITDAMVAASDHAREYSHWLSELTNKQESFAEKSNQAVKAIEDQADAAKSLADANKENALAQVDLDEKSGKISHREALNRRANIEKKAIEDSANAEQKKLLDIAHQRNSDWYAARTQMNAAIAASQTAEQNAYESPEAQARAEKLAADKARADELNKVVAESEKNDITGQNPNGIQGESGAVYYGSTQILKLKAAAANADVEADKNAQQSFVDKADVAKNTLNSAIQSFHEIDKSANEAVIAANNYHKNMPALIAVQKSTIDKKLESDLLSSQKINAHGFGLNAQQRVGAYAATPPDWNILLTNVRAIAAHTAHLKPAANQPVGSRPPQFGSRPHR